MKKIILSGSPHSGKTTTLEAIGKRHHPIVPESAITVIETLNELIGVKPCMEWRSQNVQACQDLMARKQLAREERIFPYEPWRDQNFVFIDSSPIDCFAFARAFGTFPSDWLRKVCQETKYYKVFLLDLVTPFNPRTETGRLEQDLETIKQVREAMLHSYQIHGMEPILVPLMPVEDRVDFILNESLRC